MVIVVVQMTVNSSAVVILFVVTSAALLQPADVTRATPGQRPADSDDRVRGELRHSAVRSQSPPPRWKWSGDSCVLCRHMLVGHVLQLTVVDVFVARSLVALRKDTACATRSCMQPCLEHLIGCPQAAHPPCTPATPPCSRCSIGAQTAVHARAIAVLINAREDKPTPTMLWRNPRDSS